MKFFKNLYIDLWKSEYDIYLIDDEYYLVANNKTIFDILQKEKFQELEQHLVYPLCWLINHHITPKDVEDIVCYNDVLCYVVKTENKNRYRMLPAIGGSGIAVDNAYISIGNWGEPTFTRFVCRKCKTIKYYDTKHIPANAKYEIHCPKCYYHEWRKNIR